MMYRAYLKRLLDFLLALGSLIVLSPLFLLLAVLIRVKLGHPVIFRQDRPGKDEKVFTLLKFRTMTDERDSTGNLLPDSVRLTAFGRMLRATSLDELPELVNILKGEMSLVGPRPLLVRYLPYYTEEEKLRHSVRPGLSGLAQVSGRNAVDWNTRLALDVEYVKNLGLLLDLKILLKTFEKVIRKDGITAADGRAPVYLDCERRGEVDDPRSRP
jgi:undecaprenyl phosphate N,N'-diacetylbacillosamine 1-phosphate transferase